MVRYEVTPQLLLEAGDALLVVTSKLKNLQISETPPRTKPRELQVALKKMQQMVEGLAADAKRLGDTLHGTADIYARAEQAAFSGDSPDKPRRSANYASVLPNIQKPSGVVFSGSLIIPEWLQLAAVKYEADMRNIN